MGQSKDEKDDRPIGVKAPSIIDPCKLKNQKIPLTVLPEHWSAGVNP